MDQEQHGNAGIELGLNDDLRGRNGRVRMTTDVRRRGLDAHIEVPPVPGRTVALTIDSRLLLVTDQALATAATRNKCTTGSVVIMDPRNGHIFGDVELSHLRPKRHARFGAGPGAACQSSHQCAIRAGFGVQDLLLVHRL